MSPGGILAVLVGAWVLTQVLAGDALGRLKIAGLGPTQAQNAQNGSRTVAPGPYTGVPYTVN